MFRVMTFGLFAVPSLAMVCTHVYEDMAAFNFPVEADTIRKFINPGLELDLDNNGQAWVSVLTSRLPKTLIDGLVVPLISPREVQVRTYVTGPSSQSEEKVKGLWILDLLLHEPVLPSDADIIGANVLFANTIRVATGRINVAHQDTSYRVSSSSLQVADWKTADFSWSGTVSEEPVDVPDDFFLQRDAWFGQDHKGQLFMSQLHNQKQAAKSTKLIVDEFSSSVLQGLSLGDDFGAEVFSQYPESSFFIGQYEATWDSSKLVTTGSVVV